MSLTMGSAPFGHAPAGEFNFEVPDRAVLWFEKSSRRVRGVLGGETVVDSRRVRLLHESRHLPVWYFPREDVRMDLLEPSELVTRCPHKGEASHFTVRAGDREEADAGWAYPEPIDEAPPLAGHVAFHWRAMDTWLEEDEEVHVHPRDPYHRVDVLDTSRHVRVLLDGEVLAETTRAKALFESGLPTRWYIPAADCRDEVLEACDVTTACPYKGEAEYRSARLDGREELAVAWTYRDPLREVAPIAGHWCFFQEREGLAVEVDGEAEPSVPTPYRDDAWARQGPRQL
jgi:uncharacterized protein (DUF427 family)